MPRNGSSRIQEGMTMARHRQTTKQFATQAISLATRALFLATVGLTLSGMPCAQADFFDTFSLNEPLAEHAEPSPFDGPFWPASHASTIESPTESLAPLSQQIPEQTLEQMSVPESVSRMSPPAVTTLDTLCLRRGTFSRSRQPVLQSTAAHQHRHAQHGAHNAEHAIPV